MRVKLFEAKLQSINRNFRIVRGSHQIWGLYLKMPRHPDANPAGLLHVGGITVPDGHTCMRKPWENAWGIRCRGYLEALRLLVDHKNVKADDVTRYFGSDWRTA